MAYSSGLINSDVERVEWSLEELSQRLQISMQTLVRWVGRHLIDGELGWTLSDDNEELRVIRIRTGKIDELKAFAEDYRSGQVTRTEARRILKLIDRRQVKKMVRAGDIETIQVGDETKVLVGSIEDYLMQLEQERL